MENMNEHANESSWANSLPTRDQENAAPREAERCAAYASSTVQESEPLLYDAAEVEAKRLGQAHNCSRKRYVNATR